MRIKPHINASYPHFFVKSIRKAPLYRNSHREYNKTQIKRFRHSVKLCLFRTFFIDEIGYS